MRHIPLITSVSDVPRIISPFAHATFIIRRHSHPFRGNQLYINQYDIIRYFNLYFFFKRYIWQSWRSRKFIMHRTQYSKMYNLVIWKIVPNGASINHYLRYCVWWGQATFWNVVKLRISSRFENYAPGKIDMELNDAILRKLRQIAFRCRTLTIVCFSLEMASI